MTKSAPVSTGRLADARARLSQELRGMCKYAGLTVMLLKSRGNLILRLEAVKDEASRVARPDDLAGAGFQVLRCTIHRMRADLRYVLLGEFNLHEDFAGPTLDQRRPKVIDRLRQEQYKKGGSKNHAKLVREAFEQLTLELVSMKSSPCRREVASRMRHAETVASLVNRLAHVIAGAVEQLETAQDTLEQLDDIVRESESAAASRMC